MTREYGKGYRPSPHDARDWELHKLGALSPSVPDRVNRDSLIESIYNQTGSSCTGWGTGRGWHTRARIQGDMAAPFPSAPLIYSEGRAADVVLADAPLLDQGCYPRLTLKACADLGVVPLDKWNGPAIQNARPDWETLRESADRRGVTFARVSGVDQMKVALANGYPLVVGFEVDQSFELYRGGIWNGMQGVSVGGHCTCFIGYDPDSFRGVNSWNDDWGESGLYRMSLNAAATIEAWAVQLVAS